ncbi:MAG TPA: hypothetical protein VFY99_03510 [Solirubrobacterales bacterium]
MRRSKTILIGLFGSALAALALAAPASAGAPSQSELERAGWGCVVTPTITPDPHCARPGGVESVLAGVAGTMKFLVFEPDGTYLGKELLIRGDVFRGFRADGTRFRCPQDPPTRRFTYLGPLLGIDYYACHRFDSDHT